MCNFPSISPQIRDDSASLRYKKVYLLSYSLKEGKFSDTASDRSPSSIAMNFTRYTFIKVNSDMNVTYVLLLTSY